MSSIARGSANLLLLAEILEVADAIHRAAGEPTYNQSIHEHDCGTPACALAHWYAYKGTTWLDAAVGEDLEEFAVTPSESLELFGARGCGDARTAQQAATYLRSFVVKRVRAAGAHASAPTSDQLETDAALLDASWRWL